MIHASFAPKDCHEGGISPRLILSPFILIPVAHAGSGAAGLSLNPHPAAFSLKKNNPLTSTNRNFFSHSLTLQRLSGQSQDSQDGVRTVCFIEGGSLGNGRKD